MTDNEIIKAFDVLEKFDFLQGQRAGRELWSKKPTEVQDEDVKSFSMDVAFLKYFINRQKKENSNLNSRLTSLQNDLTSAKAEIESLRRENKILSKNAAEAFQEGLNENRKLFTEEILKEFAHFLIDRSEGGVIRICDLPDLVIDFQTEENEK